MYITMAQASSDPGFTSLRGRPGRRSVKISTRDPCQTNYFFEVEMSERPEIITASYVPGGTTEVYESLSGSASNSARSSGPSAADVIFASSKLGPADPLFFCVRGLSRHKYCNFVTDIAITDMYKLDRMGETTCNAENTCIASRKTCRVKSGILVH